MARNLGTARVSVLSDGSKLGPDLKAQVEKASKGISAKIGIALDDKVLQAKIAAIRAKVEELQKDAIKVPVDVDDKQADAKVTALQARLSRLAATVAKAKTDVDIDAAVAKLSAIDAAIDKFRTKDAKATADVDTGEGETKLGFLSSMLDKFRGKDAKAKADVDTGEGETKLGLLSALLDKFSLKRVTAKATVDTAGGEAKLGLLSALLDKFGGSSGRAGSNGGNSFGNGFVSGLVKSAAMQNPGITALVIAGLGALPAAIGAVGVLGGIALGAGIMTAAILEIKKEMKLATTALKQAMTQLTKDVKAGASASTITADKTAVAAAQKQIDLLTQESAAFQPVIDGVNTLKQAFINFAMVVSKPLIKPFAKALDDMSAQLNGPLAKAFTSLFKAVGPLVKPVEDALLEIVDGILPGLTDMLNKARGPLSDMFEGFGKIVGLKVGQWFRDAIPYIKDSGTYLNELISILGSAGSFLIKFGGQLAIAFSDPDLKGFGGTVKQLGDDILKLLVPALQGWITVMAPVIKDLTLIMTPLLNFLAMHPGLVKAIVEIAAAWVVFSKAMAIARAAVVLFGLTEDVVMPWMAIITAVALIALLIIKNWKPISGFFVALWKQIWSGFVGPLMNFFTESIPHAFDVTLQWIKKNWPALVALILVPMTLGMSLVLAVIVKYHNDIVKFITMIWGHIENVITGVLKPIASVIDGAWNEIAKFSKDEWNQIVNIIKIPVLIIVGIIGEAWRGIKNLTGIIWPWLYSTTKDIWGKIENAITGVVKPIASVVEQMWTNIKNNTLAAWNFVFNTTKDVWGHVENSITGIVKPIASVVEQMWANIKSNTLAAWNFVFNTTKDIWGHVENTITGILKPIASIVQSTWKNVQNWTRDAFQAVYKFIFDPLSKAETWIGKTFVNSIEGAFKGLVSAVEAIWTGLKKVVADPINFVIQKVWNPFAKFVDDGLSIFGIKSKLDDSVAPIKFASGGHVPGYAPGSDTVPAMLSPGEYVLNPTAAKSIGVRNLDALNASVRPGGGQRMVKGAEQAFGNGGSVPFFGLSLDPTMLTSHFGPPDNSLYEATVNFAGHPVQVNKVVAPMLQDISASLSPSDKAYVKTIGGFRTSPGAGISRPNYSLHEFGDAVDINYADNPFNPSGAPAPHTMPASMVEAFKAKGWFWGGDWTAPKDYMHFQWEGGGGAAPESGSGPDPTLGLGGLLQAVLSAAANLALDGVEGLLSGALSKVPGSGPFHDMPIAAVKKVMEAAKDKLNGNPSNYTNSGPSGPAGGAGGTGMENGEAIFTYLRDNLFGGNAIAAAGATASIWGESTSNGVYWNPFAEGSGGRGLIGWTPPSTISDADYKGGLATQLPAILRFVSSSGDQGVIAEMLQATSVSQAANEWGRGVERFGVSDIHSEGISLATQIMNSTPKPVANAPKAPTPPGSHHASGGHIPGYAPGSDTVPAMLSPGEYVLNPTAVKAVGLGNLNAINFGVKPGSPQKFASGGTVAQTTIINKEGQIAKEKNLILALQAIKKPTAANILSLKNDKITLSVYDQELASYLHTNSAAAEKTALANQAAAAKAAAVKAAAKAAAVAAAKAAATAADIQKLGTNFSHTALMARAASDQKKMSADFSKNHFTQYALDAADYNMTEAALSKWPSQANAQHDAIVVNRNTAAGYASKFLAKGDLKDYAHWNQVVAKDNAAIAKLDAQISAPAQAAPPNTSNLNPIQKLAYVLGGKDSKLWTALAYQLRNHSLDPAPVGDLSHIDMSNLALNVTPSVLDVLYGGPGTNNANYQSLASALQGDLFNNSGIYNAGSGQALGILGKLTGQHGLYAGKKFMSGGMLPAGPGIGFGADGVPFSFNEGGRREKIVTEGQQNGMNGSGKLEALMAENNRLVAENTKAVAHYGKATSKGLGGVGRAIQ